MIFLRKSKVKITFIEKYLYLTRKNVLVLLDSSKLTSLDKTQTKNMNKKKTIKGKSKISINKKKGK